jgi:hypothetical protein
VSEIPEQQINCSICNKPVDLTTAKTNDQGDAVHEECCVLQEAIAAGPRAIYPANN